MRTISYINMSFLYFILIILFIVNSRCEAIEKSSILNSISAYKNYVAKLNGIYHLNSSFNISQFIF